jgi:hypothetical protein
MAQTPADNATHTVDRDSSPLAPPRGRAAPQPADLSAAPVIADTDGLLQTANARTRLCILCGRPLRSGQHMLRVHGSTIHARCSSSGR